MFDIEPEHDNYVYSSRLDQGVIVPTVFVDFLLHTGLRDHALEI